MKIEELYGKINQAFIESGIDICDRNSEIMRKLLIGTHTLSFNAGYNEAVNDFANGKRIEPKDFDINQFKKELKIGVDNNVI